MAIKKTTKRPKSYTKAALNKKANQYLSTLREFDNEYYCSEKELATDFIKAFIKNWL